MLPASPSFLRSTLYMPSHTMVRCALEVRSPEGVLYTTPVTTSPSCQSPPSPAGVGGWQRCVSGCWRRVVGALTRVVECCVVMLVGSEVAGLHMLVWFAGG